MSGGIITALQDWEYGIVLRRDGEVFGPALKFFSKKTVFRLDKPE